MAQRLAQVSGHLSSDHSRGMLAGEVAIITGAAQGIGRSAALLFAKEGAKVVVADLDQQKAQTVVDEILVAGGDAIAVGGDVGADDFPQKVLDATIKKYGKLNHIVNNAGFAHGRMLHTMPDDVWDMIHNVHVRAPFRLVRAAAPYMRVKGARENRSVTYVSSTAGLHGNIGQANYSSAKAAVIGLTKTTAKEWGPFGVRANCIAYGFIVTRLTAAMEDGVTIEINGKKVALGIPGAKPPSSADPATAAAASAASASPQIPLGRLGSPDEAAAGMLFLASPLAAYVSGHTLEVTGGMGI